MKPLEKGKKYKLNRYRSMFPDEACKNLEGQIVEVTEVTKGDITGLPMVEVQTNDGVTALFDSEELFFSSWEAHQ
ncbi:hypothetical protein BLD44_028560 [Mastigocladus laminosus UU774]|nr:hypothetical protein BLD44_028560 [Mastigocladus laminosus UU774]